MVILVNKMKGAFLILVLVVFCSSTVLAVEDGVTLGLQQIIEKAVRENIDLKIAELNLEDARLNYKKGQLNNLISNSRLLALQTELVKVQAEEVYKNVRDSVILDVIGKYIDIISVNQKLITAQKEVELQAKKVEEVKAQVEVGYKGSLELFEQETSYLSALNSLEKIKDELEQKVRELKQKAAISKGIEIEFIKLVKPEVWSVSEEDVLATAISNNIVLKVRRQQVTLAENDLEKARVSGTPEIDLRKKEIVLDKTGLELTKEQQNIENDFQNKYYLQKQSVKNMEMAEKAVIQAGEHYKIIKEQSDAGLVSKNDLLSSELRLYEAENRFTDSIINYYINMLQLQKAMGLELEVDIDNEDSSK